VDYLMEVLKKKKNNIREVITLVHNSLFSPIYFRHWYRKHAPRLLAFRNIHKEDDCFIIGNGPSINRLDLTQLNRYYTFGLNKIHLLLETVKLNLSYHVAVNPYIIEQSKHDFNNLNCPSFLSYHAARRVIKATDKIYYIATKPRPYTFQEIMTDVLCEGYTVTYVALQIAFYMGFKNVYLIGVDHHFVYNGLPNEKQLMIGDDPNHFSPKYFKNSEWQLPDLEASELSYRLAHFYYTRSGRKIFDATLDGKLEVFPKITFEEALRRCKPKK